MAVTVPILDRAEFDALKADAAELIWQLCDLYRGIAAADPSQQLPALTTEQNLLLGYEAWDGQVANGGIIQLIENGYGSFIFETPVSELLRGWGLAETAAIIDRARPLYRDKKAILEREKTLQEFAKMYQEHPEFEPLDNEYYAIMDAERERMAAYVVAHEELFTLVK